jgi:hypothetical protein
VQFSHISIPNSFVGQLVMPEIVYHGTLQRFVSGFKEKSLDSSWWRKTDRDFGAALYTTISFNQAVEWAISAEKKVFENGSFEVGSVLKLQISPMAFQDFNNCLIFAGDTNKAWTKFIVDHRYDCDENGKDPCGKGNHPSIVIGQMADNKMDIVRADYEKIANTIQDKYAWFHDEITRDKTRRRLDALQLGNQIAICDASLNELVKAVSFFIFEEGEWQEYAIDKT